MLFFSLLLEIEGTRECIYTCPVMVISDVCQIFMNFCEIKGDECLIYELC